MHRLFWACVASLILLSPIVEAQSDNPQIQPIVSALDSRPQAWWGVLIVDVVSQEVVYARNPDRSFMPASVTKVFTTAAALDQLGPDYRYVTRLYHDGVITSGVLAGNLIVRGAGDPSIGVPDQDDMAIFEAWADSLAALGIREIRGDIVGDDNIFDDTHLGADWSWDDLAYGYAAPVGGLTFHENVVDLTIQPTTPTQSGQISWTPKVDSIVAFVNQSVTVEAGERLRERYTRSLYSPVLTVETEVPVGRFERESISVVNPTLFFAEVLRQHLATRDIVVHGAAQDVDEWTQVFAYDSLQIIAQYTSAPLSELAAVTNKESHNLYAEQLLRTVGVHQPVSDSTITPGSAAMGYEAALRTYAAAGVDTMRLQLVDGSGLSRRNLVSPRMAVAMLQYMAAHDDPDTRQAFVNSLAIGGLDGTLEYRFPRGTPAHGAVRAKTGTIGNVSSLAGYVEAQSGRNYVFAIFCNHFIAPYSVVRNIQDQVINHVARTW